LQDTIPEQVIHGSNPVPKPYLSQNEENELVKFLVDTVKAGYGKSSNQIQMIAMNVAHNKESISPNKRAGIIDLFMLPIS